MFSPDYSALKILVFCFCPALSGKGPNKQEYQGRVMTLGNLDGVTISTLVQNSRDVGSSPSLGEILPIFITPTTLAP